MKLNSPHTRLPLLLLVFYKSVYPLNHPSHQRLTEGILAPLKSIYIRTALLQVTTLHTHELLLLPVRFELQTIQDTC
jgi:hypothetical protein